MRLTNGVFLQFYRFVQLLILPKRTANPSEDALRKRAARAAQSDEARAQQREADAVRHAESRSHQTEESRQHELL